MAGTAITGMIGALDLQQLRSDVGASMYTLMNELKTGTGINTNAITTVKLNALAVTAAKVGTNAITTVKINALGVTAAKVGTAAVINAKLANATVNMGAGTDGATAGKLDAIYQTLTTAGAAATATVAHGLSRTPIGLLVVKQDKSSSIYATSTWTATNIFIKSSAATVALTLMIF